MLRKSKASAWRAHCARPRSASWVETVCASQSAQTTTRQAAEISACWDDHLVTLCVSCAAILGLRLANPSLARARLRFSSTGSASMPKSLVRQAGPYSNVLMLSSCVQMNFTQKLHPHSRFRRFTELRAV